jgi:cytochrome c biogenesis protein CcmG, thiol:disulfide interchange protein DsbE
LLRTINYRTTIMAAALAVLTACYSGSHPSGIGRPAPDFTIRDGSHVVSLHDYRGKVVLLNFWATWCAPCVEELPSLVQLQSKMKGRVTVLAVSVDMDTDAYNNFIKNHHVDLLTLRDADQRSNRLYGTYAFPESYVIDRQGTIRRKFIGAVNWTDPEIEQYLNSL